MKALVAGWFSYTNGHATAGDVLARDLLCEWLDERDIAHEIAVAPPFEGGRALTDCDPADYTHVFFICGPFGKGELEGDFFRRFARCRLIGLNLSLDLSPREWNPFDFLIERDSDVETNPDMLFASHQSLPPVIGVCLVEPHPEADVDRANAAIDALLSRHPAARVSIDTRLDINETGLRSEGEVEAVIARMDALVTTRLHGLVMALKNGVPVLVIDAVPGGGKIRRQCKRIGWPNILGLDELEEGRLDEALRFALSDEAKTLARICAARAKTDVLGLSNKLFDELAPNGRVERNFVLRQSPQGMADFTAKLPALPPVQMKSAPPIGLMARIRRHLAQ